LYIYANVKEVNELYIYTNVKEVNKLYIYTNVKETIVTTAENKYIYKRLWF